MARRERPPQQVFAPSTQAAQAMSVRSTRTADSSPATDRFVHVAAKLSSVRLSPAVAIVLSIILVLAAAYGDAVTSAETTFTLFYIIAILVSIWFAGIGAGYVITPFAVAASTVASVLVTPRPSVQFLVWNGTLDLILYAAFGHVVWALRQRLQLEVAARQDAVGQLRHAERLTTLGRLASGIAHEIGTPLNVISGRAELIAGGTLSPEGVVASAKIVIAQAERVTVIIRQLLDFARRGGTRVERTDLARLADDTASLLRPLAGRSGIEISSSGERTESTVNPGELQQVITNLVTNAIHAMPDGGRIEVSVATAFGTDPRRPHAAPRNHAVISVKDHGTGIAPDVLPRIFEPFFTTRDVGVGTGLGLSVAYGIMQDHDGWMSVDTAPGKGTTVTLHLPGRSR